jgi:sugar-specific transcriptional regulator TrmB
MSKAIPKNMTGRYLSDLGFTDGEEKVYIALLKIGASTTGPIAKEANVSRSKLYEILEKLIKKAVVSHFKKNNTSHYSALPPKRILEYLKEREVNMEKQRTEFEKIIPTLEFLGKGKALNQEAQVYDGMDGIKNVRELALNNMKPGKTMYYFGNPASGHQNVLGYWDDWNKRRIAKKINAQIIYNRDAREYGERRKKLGHTKVKYLPKNGPTDAWVEIYGDTIAIVMKKDSPMSIVINNRNVAESFKTYFDILWEVSNK